MKKTNLLVIALLVSATIVAEPVTGNARKQKISIPGALIHQMLHL